MHQPNVKVKVYPFQGIKTLGACGCKGPTIAVTTLGRGRMARPTLGLLHPRKALVLILQQAEWTPKLVWTRRTEEKSPQSGTEPRPSNE